MCLVAEVTQPLSSNMNSSNNAAVVVRIITTGSHSTQTKIAVP